MKIFLSYATADVQSQRMIAWYLMHASTPEVPVELWDFRNRHERILPGEPIRPNLEARVAEADRFVLLLSMESMSRKHVVDETRAALERFPLSSIVTITLGYLPTTWPQPFSVLQGQAWLSLEGGGANLHAICADLLSHFGLRLPPPALGHHGLPIYHQTRKELESVTTTEWQSTRYIPNLAFNEILESCILAERHYFRGKACRREYRSARSILERAAHQFGNMTRRDPYYVNIAIAVCCIHLEDYEGAQEVLDHLRCHPSTDENLWGAYGVLHRAMGHFATAEQDFRKAIEVAQCAGHEFNEELHALLSLKASQGHAMESIGLVEVEALTRLADSLEEAFDRAVPETMGDLQDDLISVHRLLTLIFFARGDFSSALRWVVGTRDPILHAQAFLGGGDPERAFEILAEASKKALGSEVIPILLLLGRVSLFLGRDDTARETYRQKLSMERTGTCQYEVELLRANLPGLSIPDLASICQDLLTRAERTTLPARTEHLYWAGYLHHLLGNVQTASTLWHLAIIERKISYTEQESQDRSQAPATKELLLSEFFGIKLLGS